MFKSVKDRYPKYTPSVRSLVLQITKYLDTTAQSTTQDDDENEHNNEEDLLIESVIILLFTTRIGQSLLNVLYEVTSLNLGVLTFKDDEETETKTHNEKVLNIIHSTWSNTTLLRFLRYCLANNDGIISKLTYLNPETKLIIMQQLFERDLNESMVWTELSLLPEYNMIIDVLKFFQDQIHNVFKQACQEKSDSTVLEYILKQYNLKNDNSLYDQYIQFDVEKRQTYKFEDMMKSKNEICELFLEPLTDNNSIWTKIFPKRNDDLINNSINYIHSHFRENIHPSNNTLLQSTTNSHPINAPLNDKTTSTMIDINKNSKIRYSILANILKLKPTNDSKNINSFIDLCILVDPLTQPIPNDKYVTSIELLTNLFISQCYRQDYDFTRPPTDIESKLILQHINFQIGMSMEQIILNSMDTLNCCSYEHLQSLGLNNFENKSVEHWWGLMPAWLPRGLNTQDLELLYMVNIMAVYIIYKLNNHNPIQLNPFLSTLISVWKKLSCVILFCLDMDRMIEQDPTRETPLLVRATIRGSSALRAVIATVINGHVDYMEHDFKHEPINTFMSPHGRKLCQGALYADLRSHAAAMLSLGMDLKVVTDLLADLQAGDRFDEDIRYMFEYEYEDYNVVENEDNNDENQQDKFDDDTPHGIFQQRRCDCIFDDDKMVNGSVAQHHIHHPNDETISANNVTNVNGSTDQSNVTSSNTPFAIRSKAFFEFDYSGKDWRDVPRGFNLYYSPTYKFISNPKLEDVNKLMVKATTTFLNPSESLLLLKLVASCVKEEQESMILDRFNKDGNNANKEGEHRAKIITPDDIYELWCEDSAFEKMVYVNLEVSWKLMDEMLMCNGYRRVLIWFITHMELNHTLIHYIFELVMGLRGQEFDPNSSLEDKKKSLLHELLANKKTEEGNANGDNKDGKKKMKLPFSRQGPLVLSEIETNMLLQEFFTNAAIYLSNTNPVSTSASYDQPEDGPSNGDGNGGDDDESSKHVSLYSIGLIKLICFMVKTLMENGKFDFSKAECSFELQTLLMNWIGLIPEAQELFFIIKSSIADNNVSDEEDEAEEESEDGDETQNGKKKSKNDNEATLTSRNLQEGDLFVDTSENTENMTGETDKAKDDIASNEYSRKLMSLLPPIVEGEKENPALATLRSFMKKNTFIKDTPIIGRKVIYRGDHISPLKYNEKPISLRDYIGSYDYRTNTEPKVDETLWNF